jgi:hypothetical protein
VTPRDQQLANSANPPEHDPQWAQDRDWTYVEPDHPDSEEKDADEDDFDEEDVEEWDDEYEEEYEDEYQDAYTVTLNTLERG